MKSETKTRARGVALNADGIEALNQAATQHWVARCPGEKLTRLAKSELLGVSETTLVRILSGRRVDRISLDAAFARIGLTLAPDFVRGDSFVSEEPIDQAVVEAPQAKRPRRRWPHAAVLAIAGIGSIVGWIGYHPSNSPAALLPRDEYHMVLHSADQYYQSGEFLLAQSTLDAAFELAIRANIQRKIPEAWRLQADIDSAVGKLPDAELNFRKCMAMRLAKGERNAVPPLLEAIGDVQVRRGEFSEAKSTLEQAEAGYAEFRDQTGVAMALRDLGSLAYEMNDPNGAESRFEEALSAIHADPKQEALRVDIRARRALVMSRQGNFGDARKELQHALDFWSTRDHARWIATTKYQMATVEADAGNRDVAVSLLKESLLGYQASHDHAGVDKVRLKLVVEPKNLRRLP